MCALAVRCLADDLDAARGPSGPAIDVDKARLLALGFEQEAERLVVAAARAGRPLPAPGGGLRRHVCGGTVPSARRPIPSAGTRRRVAGRMRARPTRAPTAGGARPRRSWRRRARRSRAVECLQEAWRLALELGAVPLRDEHRPAGPAGAHHAEHDDEGDEAVSTVGTDLGLTPREVEVLGHLAAGRTDREIAECLFISKKTVSVHVSNLLRKLDVTNRVEAGRIGQALGAPAAQR